MHWDIRRKRLTESVESFRQEGRAVRALPLEEAELQAGVFPHGTMAVEMVRLEIEEDGHVGADCDRMFKLEGTCLRDGPFGVSVIQRDIAERGPVVAAWDGAVAGRSQRIRACGGMGVLMVMFMMVFV